MERSAPIYVLKRQAKALARREDVRLHVALDRIAQREGFRAWSHLAARAASGRDVPTRRAAGGAAEDEAAPGLAAGESVSSLDAAADAAATFYDRLHPGDLVLVGARPNQGKTLFAAGLATEALARGRHAAFFTLAFTVAQVHRCFEAIGKDVGRHQDRLLGRLLVDDSDDVCAAHIVARIAGAPAHTLVVIDYLQLLDQRRDQPALAEQVAELARFARERRAIVVALAQVRRSYRPSAKPTPDLRDVRLPNPVDLSSFSKACFLEGGKVRMVDGPGM